MMIIDPSTLTPMNHHDKETTKKDASNSPLMDPKIVKHLVGLLKSLESSENTNQDAD